MDIKYYDLAFWLRNSRCDDVLAEKTEFEHLNFFSAL